MPSMGTGVSLQWKWDVPIHRLIAKMEKMVKKNIASRKMLLRSGTESKRATIKMRILLIELRDRNGLISLRALSIFTLL